jgi:dCTP deaminase
MILSAQTIRKLGIFTPFSERTKLHGKSFGLSAAGYDVRVAQSFWLWPFFGRLASTIEHFDMPNDVIGIVHDKSTWARRFVMVQNTVVEPGWKGHLTLELTRFLPWPVRIKAGMPIAQILLHRLDEPTEQPYDGKYQNQANKPVAAILELAA